MNRYDALAGSWDEDWRVARARTIVAQIRRHVPEGCGHGLEFGCGTGLIGFFLADAVGEMTLVDTSAGMIEAVSEKIKSAGASHMRGLCMDVLTQPFSCPPFDFVFSSMALHHVPSVVPTLKKIRAHMAEGGTVCVVDLGKDDGRFHKNEGDFDGHHGFAPEEIRAHFRAAGFEVQCVEPFYWDVKVVDDEAVPYSLFCLWARKGTAWNE